MKYQSIQHLPRLLVVIGFSAYLAGCSSSSTTQTAGDLTDDSNGDGVVDILDGDFNADGAVDNTDLDFNGDGFVDASDDINLDGDNTFEDFDINGDGFVDSLDDTNGDGLLNSSDIITDMVDQLAACEGGSDNASVNDQWDDNCVMSTSVTYTDSSYSRGIQHILWCQGYSTQERADFADGSFGPNTAMAVEAFQSAQSLSPDGVVGEATWGALRDQLVQLSDDGSEVGYGVTSVDCDGQALFYQSTADQSWTNTRAPGSAEREPFSTGF